MPDRLPGSAARPFLLLALMPLASAPAQTFVQPYASPPVFGVPVANDPATQLGVYLRELADDPHNLTALIGAGRAALAAGDANAAIGFYGRADEASPGNARIKAGLGAAMVQLEQPREALRLFDQAAGAGMPAAEIATDRGLAYDLRGDNRRAQAEYQIALRTNPRDDEATRRYALSLAIAGDRTGALALLDPLMRRQDKAAWRASAFVLALTGDPAAAVQRAGLLLPRPQAAMIAPFFPRLAALSAAQKASAVHFGRLPGDGRPLPDTQLADSRYGGGAYPGAAAPPIRTGVTDALPDGSPVTAVPSTLPDRRTVEPSFVAARPRDRSPPARTGGQAVAGTIAPAAATPPVSLAANAPSASLLLPAGRPLSPAAPSAVSIVPTRPATTPPMRSPVVAITRPAPAPAAVAVQIAAASPRPAAQQPRVIPIVAAPAQPITVPPPAAPILSAVASVPSSPSPSIAAVGSSAPAIAADSTAVRIAAAEPPRPSAPAPAPAADVPPMRSAPIVVAPPPRSPVLDLTAATAIDRIERGPRRAAAPRSGTTDDLLAVTLPGDLPKTAQRKAPPAAEAPEDKAAARAKAKADAAAAKKLADAKTKKAEDAKATAKAKADKSATDAAAKKAPERYWVQVATGANKADLPKAWTGVKAKYGAAVAGKTPWMTPLRFTNRLLVGPFASANAAQAFVNSASKAGLGASTFTSAKGQAVERVGPK